MKKRYRHLRDIDRNNIERWHEQGMSGRAIGRLIAVSHTTINRELIRNSYTLNRYTGENATVQSKKRRKRQSFYKWDSVVEEIVLAKVKVKWSPEQISGWLKINLEIGISCERIYQHIRNDRKRGGSLYRSLRHNGKKYYKRMNKKAGKGCIPNRVDITERPNIIEEKTRIGDYEGDTIIGKGHKSAVLTVVDRHSKYLIASKLPNCKATPTRKKLIKIFKKVAFDSLTVDNGKEFSEHEKITAATGIPVYFAQPYHSWERGLNEHTNGLLRQYFPKGTDFNEVSEYQIQKAVTEINNRPRKILGFKSPAEVFKAA